jgi:hypothetical protein
MATSLWLLYLLSTSQISLWVNVPEVVPGALISYLRNITALRIGVFVICLPVDHARSSDAEDNARVLHQNLMACYVTYKELDSQ